MVEHPIEPGRLVRPRMHTREDEFSFVFEGEVGVRIGDQTFQGAREVTFGSLVAFRTHFGTPAARLPAWSS